MPSLTGRPLLALPVSEKVIYEQPLNERIRAFLRLEFLFEQVRHHVAGTTPWDSRAGLASLLDIMSIFGRSDLKSEVMKELERHTSNLTRLEQNPDVDRAQLSHLLDEMDTLIDLLHAHNGPVGAQLKTNEFLAAIQQRSSIPGGLCDFDLPAFHFWLERPAEERLKDLSSWLNTFDVIGRGIQLILKLTRGSTLFREFTAEGGFFQRSLDPNIPCQMVRVALPAGAPYYAEISGGRHRFSVRFMRQPSTSERAVQAAIDVRFELACCVI